MVSNIFLFSPLGNAKFKNSREKTYHPENRFGDAGIISKILEFLFVAHVRELTLAA